MRTILIVRQAARHEGGPGARPVATNAARSRHHDIPSFLSNLLASMNLVGTFRFVSPLMGGAR